MHSTQHKKAADHAGKKVVVVGACTSGTFLCSSFNWIAHSLMLAHDICADYYRNGVGKSLSRLLDQDGSDIRGRCYNDAT